MKNKKNSKVMIGIIALACILVVAISYAISELTLTGDKNVIMSVGDIDVTISDNSTDVISISNGLPVQDSVGKASDPYIFTIHNNGTRSVKVDIYLADDTEQLTSCNQTNGSCGLINASMIKYELITPDATTSSLLPTNRLIGTVTIAPSGSKTNELRIWLDWDASDSTAKGKYFFGKISLDVTELSE